MQVDLLKIAEERYAPDIVALLQRFHVRALYFKVPPHAGHDGMPGCWFGGRPTLPAEIDWPVYVQNGHAIPMHFLAQFDCASLPRLEEYPMPVTGTVLFFYEPHTAMERHYSSPKGQKGGKVIYLENASGVPLRDPPLHPDVDPQAFDSLPLEESDFLEYRFDHTHWNERARGRPPMLEGPLPVQAIEIGMFRAQYNTEEQDLMSKHWEDFSAAERELERISLSKINGESESSGYVKNKMFGPMSLSNSWHKKDSIELFRYSGSGPYNDQFGDSGFEAYFLIEKSDLIQKNFDRAYSEENR